MPGRSCALSGGRADANQQCAIDSAAPAAHFAAAMDMTPDKHQIEEGTKFAPRFDANGLIVAITVDAASNDVLMVAWMNEDALQRTLATGVVHYWSRSRKALWRKGDTSGQTQTLVEMRVDCDQDALLLRVRVSGDGGACHTGRRACFYRSVNADGSLSFIST
jgi:phosphoribosyl-AMP cyclohydrolase